MTSPAYRAGYLAGKTGAVENLQSNPYLSQPRKFRLWFLGYNAGLEDSIAEMERADEW